MRLCEKFGFEQDEDNMGAHDAQTTLDNKGWVEEQKTTIHDYMVGLQTI
jgi:hypothetical protein